MQGQQQFLTAMHKFGVHSFHTHTALPPSFPLMLATPNPLIPDTTAAMLLSCCMSIMACIADLGKLHDSQLPLTLGCHMMVTLVFCNQASIIGHFSTDKTLHQCSRMLSLQNIAGMTNCRAARPILEPPQRGHQQHSEPGSQVASSGFRAWRPQHRQHEHTGRNHRLRAIRVPGTV